MRNRSYPPQKAHRATTEKLPAKAVWSHRTVEGRRATNASMRPRAIALAVASGARLLRGWALGVRLPPALRHAAA